MSKTDLPVGFAFSQAALQDYADCPRRFQLRYMQRIRWPAAQSKSIEMMERLSREGAAFHRLVHQHTVGIPKEALDRMAKEDGVEGLWQSYLRDYPKGLPQTVRRSEVRLSVPLGDYSLTARYDLLAIEPQQRAVIVDWKTGRYRPSRSLLEHRYQTQVYPFVLVEAGTLLNGGESIVPEQVEFVYWFGKQEPRVERFYYDEDQHRVTGKELERVVGEILANDVSGWSFASDAKQCTYCRYQTLCEREPVEGAEEPFEFERGEDSFDLDLEQIAEIEF